MNITLELTTEEETLLRQAAAAEGTDVDAYIRRRVFATGKGPLFPDAPNLPTGEDDRAFLQKAGTAAVRDARNALLVQGIDYVYRRTDGQVVRHLPDGTEEPLEASGLTAQ